MNIPKKAFTLVELIVVIVILAILATIAFLSFSSQSASARDSTRLSDMSNIAKGLSVFSATAGSLPKPDSSISISDSGTVIGYQGYAGANVLPMVKISNGGKDPLDANTFYTYSTNASQNKFQILGFLEDGSSSALSLMPLNGNEANADPSSYTGRYMITKGDALGILLQSGSNLPLQSPGVISGTGIEITTATSNYTLVMSNKTSYSGTGNILSANLDFRLLPNRNCNNILKSGLSKGDGTYTINPTGTGSFDVYCDMSTDDGGWALVSRIIGTSSGHYTASAVGIVTSPTQTDVSKLSDAAILSIRTSWIRLFCSSDKLYTNQSNFAYSSISQGWISKLGYSYNNPSQFTFVGGGAYYTGYGLYNGAGLQFGFVSADPLPAPWHVTSGCMSTNVGSGNSGTLWVR